MYSLIKTYTIVFFFAENSELILNYGQNEGEREDKPGTRANEKKSLSILKFKYSFGHLVELDSVANQ